MGKCYKEMKYIINKDYTRELDNVFGIDKCKDKIIDYVKFLEISKNDKFANYNIIIHTDSNYLAETQVRLLDYICDRLNDNNIINSRYEYLDYSKYTDSKKKDCKNFFKEDLIIIDLDKIYTRRSGFSEEIFEILNNYNDKIFILIDNNYCLGTANATYNPYFDWFFEISQISFNDKKRYIHNLFNENNIEYEDDIDGLDDFIEQPFYMLKSQINHVLLQLKLNKISQITDDVVSKYFAEKKENLEQNKDNKCIKKSDDLSFKNLVGVENIQCEIEKIINYVKVCKQRKGKMPSLHMCFTGNPGTGKTTVARIVGQMFKKEKILSTGNFVEINGRDLVGQYVGWTAKEVEKLIKKAKGGVLFIDEAYSLNSDRRGSFEDEAIATLIKEMEDKRDDLCIILAGYQNEMKDLIDRNPGFESRIQFYIDFSNYESKDLYRIFKNLAKKENYKISCRLKTYLEDYFQTMINTDNFANGRFVRNLFEKVKIEQANRVSVNKINDIDLIKKCDVENAIKQMKKNEIEKEKFRIGFAS